MINKGEKKVNKNDLQYYLDTDKRDREHEKEPMPIIHTGVPYPPRKCPYCSVYLDSLKLLYQHLKQNHPNKPIRVN